MQRAMLKQRAVLPSWSGAELDGKRIVYDMLDSRRTLVWMRANGQETHDVRVYRHEGSGMTIIASLDQSRAWGPLLHVSIAFASRSPSWREIKALKALFYGDSIACMMVLPEADNYVNAHQNCFHLWQTPERWDMM